MKLTIHINKDAGSAYIPKAVRDEGFEGELSSYSTNLLLVLVKPGSTVQDIQQSLRLLARDLEFGKV